MLTALPPGGVGAAGCLLGDLLAADQRLLAGLLDLVLDLIGHRPQPLVLNPSTGDNKAGQEAQRDRTDGQPERVLLGQADRSLGLLLGLTAARVASSTRAAVPLAASPTREVVPVTASLARVAVSLTLDFTSSTFWLTLSLAREGTSAL